MLLDGIKNAATWLLVEIRAYSKSLSLSPVKVKEVVTSA
jgi:hypothetical protein